MVSLLPEKTWKNHGLRVDLAESLAALHPAFMRFPGGNWIEGDDLAHMYHWKTPSAISMCANRFGTLGAITRPRASVITNTCNCVEDLGCEPVFGINCGMALNGISVSMSDMGPYVQ